MIDDTDIGIRRISANLDSCRSQVMAVSLRLGDLVATATKAYKASSKDTADFCIDFPTLSELTSDVDSQRFHKSHRGRFLGLILCLFVYEPLISILGDLVSRLCYILLSVQRTTNQEVSNKPTA